MQNCKKCNASWTFHKQLESCPFCGANLLEQMKIKTIEDAFKYIISKHGISVFNEDGRLIALLADYAPALKREYSLIKIAVNAGVYGQLYEARELPSKEQIYIFNKCVYILSENCFLADVWAEQVMMWEAKALNMSISCVLQTTHDKQEESRNKMEKKANISNPKTLEANSCSYKSSTFLKELWERSIDHNQ